MNDKNTLPIKIATDCVMACMAEILCDESMIAERFEHHTWAALADDNIGLERVSEDTIVFEFGGDQYLIQVKTK